MECEQSSMTTVAHDDWYSDWWMTRSLYSTFSGRPVPSRCMALPSVAFTSRFITSPNSYCFDDPLLSMPLAS